MPTKKKPTDPYAIDPTIEVEEDELDLQEPTTPDNELTAAPTTAPAPEQVADRDRDSLDKAEPKEKAAALKNKLDEVPEQNKDKAEELKQDIDDITDWYDGIQQRLSRYDEQEAAIAKREAWETIANALGKIGAGWYGLKTGVDMSGVKFSTTDWDKKRENMLRRIKAEQDLVHDRLKFEGEEAYRKGRLGVEKQKLTDKKTSEQVKERVRKETEFNKAAAAAATDLYNISKNEDMGNEEKTTASKAAVVSRAKALGFSNEEIKEITTKEPGWFRKLLGDVEVAKSPDEIHASFVDALARRTAPAAKTVQEETNNETEPEQTKNKVAIGSRVQKDGKWYIKTEAGWKVVE